MSFDLYAPAEPPRRPPALPGLLWEKRKDGRFYANLWLTMPARDMWLGDRAACEAIGITITSGPGSTLAWDPMFASPRAVGEGVRLLREKYADRIADRDRINAGHKSRDDRAEAAVGRGEALISKHGVQFSRCGAIATLLAELQKWQTRERERSLRLEIDRLCDAVDKTVDRRFGNAVQRERTAQLAAEMAGSRTS